MLYTTFSYGLEATFESIGNCSNIGENIKKMCLPKEKHAQKCNMLYRNWTTYVHEETCIGTPQLIHDQNSDTCNIYDDCKVPGSCDRLLQTSDKKIQWGSQIHLSNMLLT